MGLRLYVIALLALTPVTGFAAPTEQCPAPQSARFKNPEAGYEFTVPNGLNGFWNSPCTSDPDGACTCMGVHGLTMPLTQEAYLTVFSSYAPWRGDADESVSDVDAFVSFSKDYARTEKGIRFTQSRAVHVNGRAGYYLVKNFREAASGREMEEIIYLFVGRSGVPTQVIISLRAPAAEIGQFMGRLKQLLKSVQWLPNKRLERP